MAPQKADCRKREATGGDQADNGWLQLRKPFSPPGRSAVMTTPTVAIMIAITFSTVKDTIAEENEAEDRGLDRLGSSEYAVVTTNEAIVHRQQHQGRSRRSGVSAPSSSHGQKPAVGHGTSSPVTRHHDHKEDDRERKAEQEADIGRAPVSRAVPSTSAASRCGRPGPAQQRW